MDLEHWDVVCDGPLSETSLRRKLETRGYRVSIYRYPPGTVFPEHAHAVDKIDAVLSGRFRLTMHGRHAELVPGDALAIPRGVLHAATVVGDEPVISLDAVRT